jgi:hypothetical protein
MAWRQPYTVAAARESHVLISAADLRYKEEALEILHEEALQAFAGGSKAAADFVEAYEQRDVGQ